ncbi:MAG: Rrf2 family transcriptional regulator [Phycisphaerales bacterium]|nr:Rrf2 family transcriptional regulator [Phycisphaerales bacterium]
MRLGRASSYAIFATAHLAQHMNGKPIQGRDIAEACGVPAGHLLKILQQLVRAQILSSERGPAGGFLLRKGARDITLLEIVEAIDGPISGDLQLRKVADEKEPTRRRLELTCRQVANHTRDVLRKADIAQLAGLR